MTMQGNELDRFFDSEFDAHEATARAAREAVRAPFAALAAACLAALAAGNKIMFFGNGGSAADAQHLAAELVVRYKASRAPLAAIALTTDSSILTAAANDFDFDAVFAQQVRALGRAGDVAIGISTSGNSPNVLRALDAAREIGAVPAALAGRDGGKLVGLADPLIVVPSDVTARIQEVHILLGHMLCDILEQAAPK
jgi:D-sedoheptulose 7-phosphate isomerase